MEQNVTRKEFLKTGAKYAAGVAIGAGAMNVLARGTTQAGTMVTPWPWPYQALDVEAARILGHDTYWTSGKGCSYSAFHAITDQLRTLLPVPWAELPDEIMFYGGGGTAGWGTLCGAINGPAALISLVLSTARSGVLNNELLGWYTQTMFPTDISNQYAVNHTFTDNRCDVVLPQNAAGSPLCHASVTEWCKASGHLQSDLERKERCARVTGDVAAFAAQMLNDELAGNFNGTYVPPATIAGCMTCHTGIVAAKMECTQCHGTNPHPASVEQVGGAALSYKLSQNYPNPFNPSTKIQFAIPRQDFVNLSIYDTHGRLVKVLLDQAKYAQGVYNVDWDGTNNSGMRVASGVYFAKIQSGSYTSSVKMSLVK